MRTFSEVKEFQPLADVLGFAIPNVAAKLDGRFPPAPDCPRCGGRGSYPHVVSFGALGERSVFVMCGCVKDAMERWEREEAERDEMERKVSVQRELLASSMLPDALRAKTFANFVVTDGNREAFVAAKEAAIGTRGVFLTGGAGTGKTHLAAAVINEKAARGRSAFFCNVPRLLADMRAAAHEGGKVDAILRAVREADLLVLDDWGAEKITDWVNEQLYVIIDGRWMDGRQLVVTSNLAPEAIRRRMGDAGERVMSRLADMCRFVAVRGEDWRMKRRAQQVA